MYEVGGWFVHIINIGVLSVIAAGVLVLIIWKRSQYQKLAEKCIRAEIQLPSGWSEFHVVPCEINAKSVSINDFIYMLDPNVKRWGKFPMSPILGVTALQATIRIESWAKDNSEPIRPKYDHLIATAAEIQAMTREIQATTGAMQIQEIDARQKELVAAISNQPSKMIVYVLLGIAVLVSAVTAIMVFQAADL